MRQFLPLLLFVGTAIATPAAAKPESPADIPVPVPDKPASEATAAESGGGQQAEALLDWLGHSGLPRWAWGLGAVAGFLLLGRLFRRPLRDDDLMGPPRPARYRDLPRY